MVATAHLKVSLYDEDNCQEMKSQAKEGKLESVTLIDQVKSLLDRKVDKVQYEEDFKTKTSKKEYEMSLQTMSAIHV